MKIKTLRAMWKENHIKALESLGFSRENWLTLRRLEESTNRLMVKLCNGDLTLMDSEYDKRIDEITRKVESLFSGNLPAGFFVNSDPRGYALKIESDNVPSGIHRDWGGYIILAPDFYSMS